MEIGWSRSEFRFAANDPKFSPRVQSYQWEVEMERVIHRTEQWLESHCGSSAACGSQANLSSVASFWGAPPHPAAEEPSRAAIIAPHSWISPYFRCGGPAREYFGQSLGKSENWPSERRLNFSTQSKNNQQPGQGMKSQMKCERERVFLSFI